MTFTHDWLTENLAPWEQHLMPLNGRPLQILEIGTYEGRSAVWFVEHLFANPEARLTCVDIWSDPRDLETCRANINETGHADRVRCLQGQSVNHLRHIMGSQFDLIYIDGSHEARDVLTDAALAWPLLAPGGYLIFDDYQWQDGSVDLPPGPAIDAFLDIWATHIEVLRSGYQVIVRRQESFPELTN